MIEDALVGLAIHLRRRVNLQVCHSPDVTPAVVFLHGGTGNRFNFRSQFEFVNSTHLHFANAGHLVMT